jgi:hypothetical protein
MSIWFYNPNRIWWEIQITKLVLIQFSPSSVTSSLLGLTVFLNTLFSKIFSLFSLLNMRDLDLFFPHGATAPSGPGPSHYRGFTITLRHTTVGRTPLDEWSAPRRDLYLTTHNTHKRQTSMPSAGFEPTIPASERPQTHALDRAATGIGSHIN